MNPTVFSNSTVAPFDMTAVQTLHNITLSAGLVIFMLLGYRFLFTRFTLPASSILSTVGTVCIVVAMNTVHCYPLLVAGIICTGFGNAVLILSWGDLWTRLDTTRVGLHLMVSCIFAYALSSVLCLLPSWVVGTVVVCLPIISWRIMELCRQEATQRKSIEPRRPLDANLGLLIKRFLCAIIVISLAYGASKTITIPSTTGTPFFLAVSMTVIFVIMFFAAEFLQRHDTFIVRVYRVMFASLTVGFLCLPFLPENLHWLSSAIIACGARLLNQLVWLIYPEIVVKINGMNLRLFGWAAVCLHIFTAIGVYLAKYTLPILGDFQSAALYVLSAVSVTAIVFLMIFILKESDFKKALQSSEATPCNEPEEADACKRIAEKYGLSDKELDVLRLLSSGRTIPFISQELYVSQSTAKTYTRRIYSKMGIHSRQDLHDIVEKFS